MGHKTKDKKSFIQKEKYEAMKNEIILTAILNAVYAEKVSKEAIQTKVNHQLNSMQVSMDKINPKFNEKSKNYDKVKQQTRDILKEYETNLVQFCKICDVKIQEAILKKTELEFKWLVEIMKRGNNRKNLEKEIQIAKKKINQLNEQKVKNIFAAMETGEKAISTQIRKPRTIKKITKFFMNRLNTYSVIVKSVMMPIQQRIDEFKVNALEKVNFKNVEFDLTKLENEIKNRYSQVYKQEIKDKPYKKEKR